MPSLEYCQLCNSETGRAGRLDNSIYLDIPNGDEVGPLCEDCYMKLKGFFVLTKENG